ncbi:MAG: hypothetical protein M3P27_10255 [Acidobacteriota bacterium]|nr:hypothetical protein [Acidobacteriota bacterium]
MAKILSDKDVRKLLGTVILDADEKRLNPNGIEIRLGKAVLFHSTDEEKELGPDMFLRVAPGETVTISSYEDFRFTKEAIGRVFPGCDMMALITPTTTMMREGILQSATKVDSGWDGTLNWGLRNSSIRDFVLGYGEPIFKLTFFLLEGDEIPDIPYGQRANDRYQNTKGIARSTRTIPANIPKGKLVASSVEKLDPKKQLREAGYPFNHISSELTELHGKFEIVSNDVMLLKDTIADEARKLSGKVDDSQRNVLDKVESLFDRKFMGAIGRIIAAGSVMFGAAVWLQGQGLSYRSIGAIGIIAGIALWMFMQFFVGKKKASPA